MEISLHNPELYLIGHIFLVLTSVGLGRFYCNRLISLYVIREDEFTYYTTLEQIVRIDAYSAEQSRQ